MRAAAFRPALAVAALLVCGAAVALEARDDLGTVLTLARPAQRVVTLAPSATELVDAAGAFGRIVATVATSDWPPAARTLPRIGDAFAVDLERVVALEPDLVVTWPYTVPAHVARLRSRRIPVFVVDPRTIDGIASVIASLSILTGTTGHAAAVARGFERRLAALRERYQHAPPLRVFYEVWDSPLYTIGRGHLITEAISLCGGVNVFGGVELPAPQVAVEAVIAAAPEVIVAGTTGAVRPPWLDAWRRYPAVPAVAAGALLTVDANLLHRPGPRFLDGVTMLCESLDRARAAREARVVPPPR